MTEGKAQGCTYEEFQAFPFLSLFQPLQFLLLFLQDLHVSLDFLLDGEKNIFPVRFNPAFQSWDDFQDLYDGLGMRP